MVLQDNVTIKNHCSSTKTVHLTTKIGRIVPYFERLLFTNSLNPFWSRGLAKSCEMLKTYLPYHSIYDHQTWKGGNLLWGAPSYEVLCLLSHLVMRGQVTNYIMWKKTLYLHCHCTCCTRYSWAPTWRALTHKVLWLLNHVVLWDQVTN